MAVATLYLLQVGCVRWGPSWFPILVFALKRYFLPRFTLSISSDNKAIAIGSSELGNKQNNLYLLESDLNWINALTDILVLSSTEIITVSRDT